MLIGHLKELWRYPVKSLGGESCEQLELTAAGVVGDRHWAVYDPQAPMIRSAKQWPALLSLQAQYLGQPGAEDYGEGVAPVRLISAEGDHCDSTDLEACAAWLDRQLARPAQLRPRLPAAERAFYQLARPRTEAQMRREMGLAAGEAMPDFSKDFEEMSFLLDCVTPPGQLYDAFPLHLLTTDSLAFIAEQSELNTDVRRFRPNLLLETVEPRAALTEQQWVGSRLAMGEVVLRIHSPMVRCSMPAQAQPHFGLDRQAALPRTIARHADRNLGVGVYIEQPGRLRAGDPVHLLAD